MTASCHTLLPWWTHSSRTAHAIDHGVLSEQDKHNKERSWFQKVNCCCQELGYIWWWELWIRVEYE